MRSVARRSGVPAFRRGKNFPLRRNPLSAREAEKSASRAESAPLVPPCGTRGSRNAARGLYPQLFSFLITEHCEKKYKKINYCYIDFALQNVILP